MDQLDQLNLADLLLQVFGPGALQWIAVVGVCLVVWSQLRAAIPQAWWEKLPRPVLVVLDVLAANWGSAKNGSGSDKRLDPARPAGSRATQKLP
ncbi:hypothetical protein ELS78_21630 [Aeromonas veronii]|uniref:hypothetical protein n=1 Tax=Aeromonas veronii TaxID=654 RepID=UPI000F8EEC34|nr:hypothetical protein [Aeromonas veronii]RUR52001.1 hypothetical protein ELS78_21630 [Aeromonas veronii]